MGSLRELTDREVDVQVAEQIMGLVPCTGDFHKKHDDPSPCHARPESPDQGAETRLYSTDAEAAMEVRDVVHSWIFSERRKFKLALQRIIGERLGMSDGLVHSEEVILHFTPRDICIAALSVRNPDAVL